MSKSSSQYFCSLAIERFIAAIFGFGFDPGNVHVKEIAMTETVAVRAIIVDPRSLFCDAIGVCLTKGGYVALSQAQNLDEAMRQADSLHPDLMIIGPQLTEESLVVCREMTKRLPTLKIIIFTAHADERLFRADAAYAGVAACLRPESTDEKMLGGDCKSHGRGAVVLTRDFVSGIPTDQTDGERT